MAEVLVSLKLLLLPLELLLLLPLLLLAILLLLLLLHLLQLPLVHGALAVVLFEWLLSWYNNESCSLLVLIGARTIRIVLHSQSSLLWLLRSYAAGATLIWRRSLHLRLRLLVFLRSTNSTTSGTWSTLCRGGAIPALRSWLLLLGSRSA